MKMANEMKMANAVDHLEYVILSLALAKLLDFLISPYQVPVLP